MAKLPSSKIYRNLFNVHENNRSRQYHWNYSRGHSLHLFHECEKSFQPDTFKGVISYSGSSNNIYANAAENENEKEKRPENATHFIFQMKEDYS